jgi:hypothetical protein
VTTIQDASIRPNGHIEITQMHFFSTMLRARDASPDAPHFSTPASSLLHRETDHPVSESIPS